MNIALVTGGFDPLHYAHIRLFEEAASYGELTVGLNSDDWLMRKKSYVFMPWDERFEIISALRCVDSVTPFDDDDGTCLDFLKTWVGIRDSHNVFDKLYFINGGDRNPDDDPIPEEAFCKENNIELIYGCGGYEKLQSSSDLVKKING